MNNEILHIPFRYHISVVHKGRRKTTDYVVADTAPVTIEKLSSTEAPPVVAVWRPRPDEQDGQPIEFRHDGTRFFMPVFPEGYPPKRTQRLTSEEFLAAMGSLDAASEVFNGHHPLTYQPYKPSEKPPLTTIDALPPLRSIQSNRDQYVAHIAKTAAEYVLIEGHPFRRCAEPVLHVAYRREKKNGFETGRHEDIITVEMDNRTDYSAGFDLFRLTSTGRALDRATLRAAKSNSAPPSLPDVSIVRTSPFTYDDETPLACSDLIDAAREVVNARRGFTDDRITEMGTLTQHKDPRDYRYHPVSWDSPNLPRVAELLAAVRHDNLVDKRTVDEVDRALSRWRTKPVHIDGSAPPGNAVDIDLPAEMVP
jgi:hypothetical protein